LADVAHDVLNADKTSVSIWDPQRQELVIGASIGYSSESNSMTLVGGVDLPLDRMFSAEAFVISDVGNDPMMSSPRIQEIVRREGIRSAIGAPIMVSGTAWGLFGVAFCS